MPRLIPFGKLLCAGLLGVGVASAQIPPEAVVWEKVASYLSVDADRKLDQLPEPVDAAQQRERDFCSAVVHLDQQPLSESRLDEVQRRLQALLNVEDNDEIGRASRYLMGRIAQVYRAEPDIERAARYFRGLLEQPGPGEWDEQARLKLTLLTLYLLPVKTPAERIEIVRSYARGARAPLAVRDMHRLLARAILFYNLKPSEALEHLLQADAVGGLTGTQGADQLVQIGELAWDEGDKELAAHYYERLRDEFPRDPRVFMMNERLAGRPTPERGEVVNGR